MTYNEALRTLDILVLLSVKSSRQTTPPPDPAVGDCYIIPENANADWSSNTGQLATWEGTYWHFTAPTEGCVAWNAELESLMIQKGGSWGPTPTELHDLSEVEINSTADAINRLCVSSDASLFSHDQSGNHSLKINRNQDGDTPSLQFQINYLSQAEIGLAGTDALSWKVSEHGATFRTAISIDHVTGKVDFSFGVTGISRSGFGSGNVLTVDYSVAKGTDLVVTGSGFLGNN